MSEMLSFCAARLAGATGLDLLPLACLAGATNGVRERLAFAEALVQSIKASGLAFDEFAHEAELPPHRLGALTSSRCWRAGLKRHERGNI